MCDLANVLYQGVIASRGAQPSGCRMKAMNRRDDRARHRLCCIATPGRKKAVCPLVPLCPFASVVLRDERLCHW
jgi:hypothetical protein